MVSTPGIEQSFNKVHKNMDAKQVIENYSMLMRRGQRPNRNLLNELDADGQAQVMNELSERMNADQFEWLKMHLGYSRATKAAGKKKPEEAPAHPNTVSSLPAATTSTPQADYAPYHVHPFADLFPLIQDDEFNQLVEDIRVNGLLEPVILSHDGSTIIDGRNRYRACKAAGVETRTIKLDESVSVIAFIVSKNLARRHLTTSQRALLAAQSMPYLEAEARERQLANLKQGKKSRVGKFAQTGQPSVSHKEVEFGRARDQAAKAFGVSSRSVGDAKKLLQADPVKAAEVSEGKTSLNAAKEPKKREPNYTRQLKRDAMAKACPECKKRDAIIKQQDDTIKQQDEDIKQQDEDIEKLLTVIQKLEKNKIEN